MAVRDDNGKFELSKQRWELFTLRLGLEIGAAWI